MKIVKLILFSLFGLMFINAGLNKFFNYMPMPELSAEQKVFFSAIMQIKWLMPLVAVVEIVGGILFLIPKLRALGAIIILPVMAGIFVHHLIADRSGIAMATVLMIINILAIIDNKEKYKPIIS